MLFQSDIQNLESEIANLQAVIAARQSRIDQLNQAENVAGSAIQTLQDAVAKVSELAPDAIALLKSAVMELFSNGEGGDNPSPEPTPDDDGNDNPGSFDDFGGDDDSPADDTNGGDEPTNDTEGNRIPAGSLVQIENPATGEKISWVTPAAQPTEITSLAKPTSIKSRNGSARHWATSTSQPQH